MTDLKYPPCKKCGASHTVGIENMVTGEVKPIDLCKDCLFDGCEYDNIKKRMVKIQIEKFEKKLIEIWEK